MKNKKIDLINGKDLRALLPFLACNIGYSFDIINTIYHEDKYDRGQGTSPLYIFTEKEFKEYLKQRKRKPTDEKPYVTPIYDISSNQIVWFNLYTDKNIDMYNPYNSKKIKDDIAILFNSLVEFYNRSMIIIEFDSNEIYKESYKYYDLEESELIFYDYKTLVEKIYVLLETLIKNVFKTENKILLNLVFYEVLNRKVSLSIVDNNYADISANQLENIYEYSRLILEFLNVLLAGEELNIHEQLVAKDSTYENPAEKINEFIFSDLKTNEVFNEIKDFNINPMLNSMDEINILQSYKMWSLGNKDKYISNLKNLDNMADLSDKLSSFPENKLKTILLNNQISLQIIRSKNKDVKQAWLPK